jgi:adenylate kinase family enzyme
MDDNVLGTKKRVYEFKRKMEPVIAYYKKSGRLNVVDGNASPDVCRERFAQFHRRMQNLPLIPMT